jgi:hypothetical protein
MPGPAIGPQQWSRQSGSWTLEVAQWSFRVCRCSDLERTPEDPTRKAEFYDGTFEYLKGLGLPVI